MKPTNRIVLTAAAAAAVLGAGASIATAAHTTTHKATAARIAAADTPTNPGGGPPGGPPGAAAIASYLGLTQAELKTKLQSGKTLAQVATAQGKTAGGLEDAIVADATSHLDADVAAGDITAAQESSRLSDLKSHVDDIVNSTGPPNGGHGGPGGPGGPGSGPDSAAILSYLGLTQAELKTQLQSGKTLAQVAVAQGKTAKGLEDAIVADATTHLDAAVAAGKLTAAQETSMLADLRSHVDDMVNSSGPPKGGRGPGGFGPPPGAGSSSSSSSGTLG
jgi:hypothetical protein